MSKYVVMRDRWWCHDILTSRNKRRLGIYIVLWFLANWNKQQPATDNNAYCANRNNWLCSYFYLHDEVIELNGTESEQRRPKTRHRDEVEETEAGEVEEPGRYEVEAKPKSMKHSVALSRDEVETQPGSTKWGDGECLLLYLFIKPALFIHIFYIINPVKPGTIPGQ